MEADVPKRDPTARAAAGMGIATFASRGIGLLRVWVITAVLGTTYLGNAFQASNAVSNVLFELLAAGALSAVLVPTFVELLNTGDDTEAERLAGGVLGLALVVLGVVTVVGVLAAPVLARLLTSGAPQEVAPDQAALATFLLRFFVPQVLLYAFGTVATALLYAKRHFVVTAIAPIANTVVIIASLVVFRLLHGEGTALDLTVAEKLVLALGGTLGVLGFVGVPVIALHRTGTRLRPRVEPADPRLRRLLHLSTWAIFQHAGIGILLGGAIVMGNRVAGGVVAYQFAFVAFMAPYAILAQPVHTTILPLLTLDAARDDPAAFGDRTRDALGTLALLTLPVSAALIALAEPAMRVVSVGASRGGVDLLATALASLGVGLYPYSAFLLLARAFYARHDSRTPALVALVTAFIGVAVMVVGSSVTHGTARVAALGIGHSAAYVLGAVVLGALLARRLHRSIVPSTLVPAFLVSAALGVAAWQIERWIAPSGRVTIAAVLAAIGAAGAAVYFVLLRALRRLDPASKAPPGPEDPDMAGEP